MVIAGVEQKERLIEVMQMLTSTNNPQVEYFVQIMKKWANENGFKFWLICLGLSFKTFSFLLLICKALTLELYIVF